MSCAMTVALLLLLDEKLNVCRFPDTVLDSDFWPDCCYFAPACDGLGLCFVRQQLILIGMVETYARRDLNPGLN
jgi:hypothetical protein